MARAKAADPAETLRQHYATVAKLVGSGAAETAIGAALTAAEQAGLDRTALRQAVREGRLDRERRAEVAASLDRYRLLLDPPPPLAGLAPTLPTSSRAGSATVRATSSTEPRPACHKGA